MKFQETLEKIEKINDKAKKQSKERWDSIAKPLNSLGKIETGIQQIAGIIGNQNVVLDKKALIIMCADNGIVEENVTQSTSEITAIVAENFLDRKSCVSIMCEKLNVDLYPLDIGMIVDTRVENRKISYGTKNFLKEPAMSKDEVIGAIEVGIQKVKELKERGYQIIATGEMGIGNTTTSSAVASVLLDVEVEKVTGKGAGLSSEGLLHKIEVIKRGIQIHQPNKEDPIDVLSKVGGLDLAGLVGVYLGGAAFKIPVVIDGFISSVAALIAQKLAPLAKEYMMSSHVSKEPAGRLLLEALEKDPYITGDMCLGEGTGAVMLFPVLDLGLEIYNRMSTFQEIEIEAYEPLE